MVGQAELERWRHELARRVREEDAAPGDLEPALAEVRRVAHQPQVAEAVEWIDAELVAVLGCVGPHRLTTTPHPGPAPLVLGSRFGEAVTRAAELHAQQTRKDTLIPYVSHLLGAAANLLEQPGATEDQAIAALLHDSLEDCADQITSAQIEAEFGAVVARIVRDCTDTEVDAPGPKRPWPERKVAYLEHLRTVGRSSLQVSLADKLHNATAILRDSQALGTAAWDRFSAPAAAQRWYYTSLAEVFTRRLGNEQSLVLARTVVDVFDGVDPAWAVPGGYEPGDDGFVPA